MFGGIRSLRDKKSFTTRPDTSTRRWRTRWENCWRTETRSSRRKSRPGWSPFRERNSSRNPFCFLNELNLYNNVASDCCGQQVGSFQNYTLTKYLALSTKCFGGSRSRSLFSLCCTLLRRVSSLRKSTSLPRLGGEWVKDRVNGWALSLGARKVI